MSLKAQRAGCAIARNRHYNVASLQRQRLLSVTAVIGRMESTVAVGRIQVPQPVYEQLRSCFVFEDRGAVDVKGKGVMHTWYLVGRKVLTA